MINFTQLNTSVPFSIDQYEIYDYILDNTQSCAALNITDGKSDHSINIKTSQPVTVYATNRYTNVSNDVTNVLPVAALGREYYQISYPPVTISLPPIVGLDAYAVVATQNNTVLSHNESYIATLDSGQVYYKTSSTDMTGAHIISNHPVAFFAVNSCAQIPYGEYADYSPLFQQLSPVNTWGKTFFVPVTNVTKDIVRIVASQNNTKITKIIGGTIRTGVPGALNTLLFPLQAGQFVELDINLENNGCYIEADKSVGVCTYFNATPYPYSGLPYVMPAQCWVPGIEQTVSKALMAPFLIPSGPLTTIGINYALVVTPKDTRDSTKVSIAGASPVPLSGGSWHDNDTAKMSFYSMPLTEHYSSYIFSNPKGMIVFEYNTGIYLTPSSYYYLAYSAMRDLDAAFYANDIHYRDLENTPVCDNEIEFRAEIDGKGIEIDSIKWYIGENEKISARNQETWSDTLSDGPYEITMWVLFENDSIITRTGTLKIISCDTTSAAFYVNNIHYENFLDTVFCDKNVNFRAEIEGLNANDGSLKWFIDDEEYVPANPLEWSKEFDTGEYKEYEIKMEVLFDNNETAIFTRTLKMNVFWVKIRNVRY